MKKLFRVHNTVWVVKSLLHILNVKVNTSTVRRTLKSHPDYPSLSAVSECLNEFNVPNQCYQIILDEYDKNDLLFPFIAFLPENNGSFIIIKNISNDTIHFSSEDNQHGQMSEKEFLSKWKGIALHAEASEKSIEKDYFKNKIAQYFKYFAPLFIIVVICAISYIVFKNYNLSVWFLGVCAIKIIGACISILLLIQSINSNNHLILGLCNLTGKNNCNSLLKSDASKVNSWLNWSEVGLFYFSGSLISLIILPQSIGLISWLGALTLPYTIYSISYQYRIKNWCILCCGVQLTLWMEFIALTAGSFFNSNIIFDNLYFIAICFFTPAFIWFFLKPFFVSASEIKLLQKQLQRFKYNGQLFNQTLTSQPKYAIHDDLMPIVLGNPDAKHVITMVSNPFCEPCGKAHETLSKLLSTNEDIQLKIVFSTNNQDHDERSKVAKHLIAFGTRHNKAQAREILEFWYKECVKYDQLTEKFPLNFNEEINEAMENQKKLCNLANITFTPAFFINGYKLPEPYRINDLKYLIDLNT